MFHNKGHKLQRPELLVMAGIWHISYCLACRNWRCELSSPGSCPHCLYCCLTVTERNWQGWRQSACCLATRWTTLTRSCTNSDSFWSSRKPRWESGQWLIFIYLLMIYSSHLSLLSHCGLILAKRVELVCTSWSPVKRKGLVGNISSNFPIKSSHTRKPTPPPLFIFHIFVFL